MSRRRAAFLGLAVLLAALAGALFHLRRAAGPAAEEATYVMMAQSLWRDGDLRYGAADLARADDLWPGGPDGLVLAADGGDTPRYGRPALYPLLAVPFLVAFGPPGLTVLNMLLYLFAAWAALRLMESLLGGARGGVLLYLGGFFFASTAPLAALRAGPGALAMAGLFLPLALWARWRSAGEGAAPGAPPAFAAAGLGLAAAAAVLGSAAPLAAGAVAAGDLLLGRRFRRAGALAAGALAMVAICLMWRPLGDPLGLGDDLDRRAFEERFPLEETVGEAAPPVWDEAPPAPPAGGAPEAFHLASGRWWRAALLGRHGGLLPYYPFAFLALGLYLAALLQGRTAAWQHLLLLAAAVFALFSLLPGQGASLLTLYPLLAPLPGRRPGRWSLALASVAAGLWAAPVLVASAVAPAAAVAVPGELPAFRPLPLELGRLAAGELPGYALRPQGDEVWAVPRATAFPGEANPAGFWLRGASWSEVVVASPRPLEALRFTVYTPWVDNRAVFAAAGEVVAVSLDTEGKRLGTPIELPARPAARDLGLLPPPATPEAESEAGAGGGEWVYRFTVQVEGGWVPRRRGVPNADPRFLGIFLSLTGDPP